MSGAADAAPLTLTGPGADIDEMDVKGARALAERIAEEERRRAEGPQSSGTDSSDSDSHLLFLVADASYLIREASGPAPVPGTVLDLLEGRFRVARVGASPYPDDSRACAFLEAAAASEEPLSA